MYSTNFKRSIKRGWTTPRKEWTERKQRDRERERGEEIQKETGEANRILRAVRLLNLFAEDKQSQLYNWQRSFVASLSLCGRQLYNEYEILQNPRNRNKNNTANSKEEESYKTKQWDLTTLRVQLLLLPRELANIMPDLTLTSIWTLWPTTRRMRNTAACITLHAVLSWASSSSLNVN